MPARARLHGERLANAELPLSTHRHSRGAGRGVPGRLVCQARWVAGADP